MASGSLKLNLYISMFLLLVLAFVMLVLAVLLDFIGVIDIKKEIPPQIKGNKYVKMYLDKANVMQMTEEERIKFGIERERRAIAEKKDLIQKEFLKFKEFQDEIRTEKDRLTVLRQDIQTRQETLEEKEKEFDAQVNAFNIQKERLDKIVSFIEKMPADKSAALVQGLDTNLVVMIFLKLKVKTAAGILGILSPEKAKEITNLVNSHKIDYSTKNLK